MNGKLSDHRVKKKQVWAEIATVMNAAGYSFSADDCSKKWSNMELRFV